MYCRGFADFVDFSTLVERVAIAISSADCYTNGDARKPQKLTSADDDLEAIGIFKWRLEVTRLCAEGVAAPPAVCVCVQEVGGFMADPHEAL